MRFLKKRNAERATEEERAEQRADRSVVALLLAIKLLVLLFGGIAYEILQNKTLGGLYGWLAVWNQWDSQHYQDVAHYGYVTEGDQRPWIVFFPLFPWLVRWFAILFRDYLLSAFVVSTLSSIALVLVLRRLAELDVDRAVAINAVWFMLIFPTSYFLHIGYTESTFLAFALGSFLAARRGKWWLAGLMGAFASLTRLNGLLLVPALACEAFLQYRATAGQRKLRREWLWIALVGVGSAVYLLINYKVHGDPFAFLTFQRERFFKMPAWPWVGIIKVWTWQWGDPRRGIMNGPIELFFILLGLACTVWCWKKLRVSYAVWMGLNWLLFTSTSMVNSVPRYTLILFPIFVLFAAFTAARPVWSRVIAVVSLVFMTLFIGMFVQGAWAY